MTSGLTTGDVVAQFAARSCLVLAPGSKESEGIGSEGIDSGVSFPIIGSGFWEDGDEGDILFKIPLFKRSNEAHG